MRRWPTLAVALPVVAIAAAGCIADVAAGGPDFDVDVRNDRGEPVAVRFRATFGDTGEVVADWSATAPPGRSVLGHVKGPKGDYLLEAWAGDSEHEAVGPGMGLERLTDCGLSLWDSALAIDCEIP